MKAVLYLFGNNLLNNSQLPQPRMLEHLNFKTILINGMMPMDIKIKKIYTTWIELI